MTSRTAREDRIDHEPHATLTPSSHGRRAIIPVVSMLVVTLVGAVLPIFATRTFYFWDDTAAAAVGVWHRVAQSVLSGELPLMNLDMWRGGNFIAEAATGMFNPVMLALMLGTYPIDNIAIAMTVAKAALLLISAGGVYVLARDFKASRWMAAVAGMALSLSGWAIFMDGAAWINGTAIMAFASWAWWALRRCIRPNVRARDVIIAVIISSLLPSTGNPYGLLVLAFLFLALGVEALVQGRARRLWLLVLIGLSVLLVSVIVYLPFVLTSAYGNRADSGIWNDEFLAVNLSDLFGMSTPTHIPSIKMWGDFMHFPGAYLAWFVLPLLPWLRWGWFKERRSSLTSIMVFGAIMLMLVLGPSQLWMFRWPARLLPFLYLAVIVFFAVAASHGFIRTKTKLRSLLSVGIVLLGVWIAVSDKPYSFLWHSGSTIAVIAAILLIAHWARREWLRAGIMMLVTVAFLGVQLVLAPTNSNVADYMLPTSRAELQKRFADYSDGVVVQVFDVISEVRDRSADERWANLLPGNMPAVAGYPSLTAYSGIGFTKLDQAMCTTYNGGSCYELWDRLWESPEDGEGHVLADLIGADTVVVTREGNRSPEAPEGWSLADSNENASVFTRDTPLPGPGTVTATDEGITITDDERSGAVSERLTLDSISAGHLYFGRIAWPGYTVKLDGEPLKTEIGPAGLLTVEVPAGVDSGEIVVDWTPPGLTVGLGAAGAGVLVAAGAVLLVVRERRRADGQVE